MTSGPSSAAAKLPEPEYSGLHFVDVEITDGQREDWTVTRGLLDSGSQGSCVNKVFSTDALTDHRLKQTPTTMIMADGHDSPAGPITQYNPAKIRVAGHEEEIALDATSLSHPIILGMPWHKKHNPRIDYRGNTMTFDSEYCREGCSHYGKTVPLHTADKFEEPPHPGPAGTTSPAERDDLGPDTTVQGVQDGLAKKRRRRPRRKATAGNQNPKLTDELKNPEPNELEPHGPETKGPEPKTLKEPPKVALIGANAFAFICNQLGTELYFMTMEEMMDSDPVHLAAQGTGTPKPDPDLSQIPLEYHLFADLFSEREADKLPAHRSYDHTIPLEPGKAPPFGPIYKLSPVELEVVRKYVADNLRKGFLRHSQSPCGAPIVFAKKADGTLRLCVDYRGLNKITIKNRYPLPLIGELLERISKAKYFTKFDVRDGYNRLRIAPGEEWKTAFRCRYGLFEYTVMPFGLCNAPGTFQHYMNDTFRDFLDEFLVVYLDDLLIYSDSLKEHRMHVRKVLERLREAGLFLKPSKCVFHVQEVEFLGFVLGVNGVRMDPKKVESVTSWPTPRSPHDVRMFLGLANFYRRFIKGFSQLAAPLTRLLKKENMAKKFNWTQDAGAAFEQLKVAFTTAPILMHFDSEQPTILEADASTHALGAVISQLDAEGKMHPVAFHSRKFNPAELNYDIYDKEMLAIVDSLEHYRHLFEGLGQQITIYSDHHNLLWFTETKVYNRRQARWAEKLAKYDFVIHFRPGAQGGKPDALSRRPDYVAENKVTQPTPFLRPEQIDTTEMEIGTVGLGDDDLKQAIQEAQESDLAMEKGDMERVDGLWLKGGRVYIPANQEIKLRILKAHHDGRTAGHLGQDKTLDLIAREYTWPGIRKFVNEYVRTCDTCARNKTSRRRRHGQLNPLPIPNGPWKSVSMDFVVQLPPSQGYDAIYVCVDRFTKMAHFVPTRSEIAAEGTADLYLRNVFKNHGLPEDIVSDRGTQFVAKFARRLLELLDVKGNRSTAYHPQSDGQTERTNQMMEQYLRIYCDYHQDDWSQLLPLAEFAYNNAKNVSTGVSPFYANYGYHPRATLKILPSENNENPAAEAYVNKVRRVHEELRTTLEQAQEKYKANFDRKTDPAPEFKVGDLVWLNRRNIETTRPSQKLDVKQLGPFEITKVVGESKAAFELKLPPQWRIHPVFHSSLLEPYRGNTIEGRNQLIPQPPELVDGRLEYEVEGVLDSRIQRNRLRYLVEWKGYGPEERTWEPLENLENSRDLIAAFHRLYPNRPSEKDLQVRNTEPRRSSVHRKGGTVINDRPARGNPREGGDRGLSATYIKFSSHRT